MEQIPHDEKLKSLMDEAASYFRQNYMNDLKSYLKKVETGNNTDDEDYLGSVHIYSHLDADGLSAAAIIGTALKRESISYQITILKQLEEQYFPEIKSALENNNQFAIFTDFGSGQQNLFSQYLPDSKYLILDHHEILKDDQGNDFSVSGHQVNPYMAGINGSNEISGAGMAYLFSIALNQENKDLSYLAIAGAIGDIQNVGPQKTFIGENQAILSDATSEEMIKTESEPGITRSKSLLYALAFTLPVILPKIHNNMRAAAGFLKRAGIKMKNDFGDARTLADLSSNEKKILTSALLNHIMNSGLDLALIDKVIHTSYLINPFEKNSEIYDSKDFSKMLNACGRLNKPSVALSAMIIKSPEAIKQAIKTSEEYTKLISSSSKWLEENNKLQKKSELDYFYGEDVISENLVGIICSKISFSNSHDPMKAIIGYANSDHESYKVSARCSKKLVDLGVNLSTAIRDVCNQLGIEEKGGGHPPASGAKIPRSKMDDFITNLNEVIKNQKNNK